MKKYLLTFLFVILFSSIALADAPFHIGILTPTVSQQEEELRAAEALIEEYGKVSDGGYINHLTLPDNFMTEMETTISQVLSFADDPKMKAIVANQAVVGIFEAFRRVRELRPDILLFAGHAQEDPKMIADVVDLSLTVDQFSRGYIDILAAKRLGAENILFITFPRHMSLEITSGMNAIEALVCKDFGMNFITVGAPDPLSDVGLPVLSSLYLKSSSLVREIRSKNRFLHFKLFA